jgi:Family of unknown function (DUF6325)
MTDYAVIEFSDTIDDGVIGELLALVAAGTVRILDLAVIAKDAEGRVSLAEVEEVEDLTTLRGFEQHVVRIVAEEDMVVIAEVLEPGTTALLVVWENLWSLRLGHAVRSSGGQVVASGRIPTDEIAAALEAASA